MDGNKKSSITVTTAKEEIFSESNLLSEICINYFCDYFILFRDYNYITIYMMCQLAYTIFVYNKQRNHCRHDMIYIIFLCWYVIFVIFCQENTIRIFEDITFIVIRRQFWSEKMIILFQIYIIIFKAVNGRIIIRRN